MTRKTRKMVAIAAALLSLGTVTAFAATRPPALVGVTKSSMNGVNHAAGAHGALKTNAVGNRQIKFGSVSCGKLSADLVAAICTGKPGAPGTPGAPGANGNSGSKGDNGGNGSKGDGGSNGNNGHDGSNGNNGKDAAVAYGAAQVLVARHGGTVAAPTFNPSVWASFSAPLGSPLWTQAGGTFRFTCNDTQAPCEISVKAAVLGSTNHAVYPRILVYKSTPVGDGGPEGYCEYADGSTGAAPMSVTAQASTATPAYTAVPMNIGGTADCGIAGPAGDVNSIVVPSGYYDVQSTFSFLP